MLVTNIAMESVALLDNAKVTRLVVNCLTIVAGFSPGYI